MSLVFGFYGQFLPFLALEPFFERKLAASRLL
jgi:hypothetical protein